VKLSLELSKEHSRYGVGDFEYYISIYDLVFVVGDNIEEQINMCPCRPPHTVQTNCASVRVTQTWSIESAKGKKQKKESTEYLRKSHITSCCTAKGGKKKPFAIIVARPAPAPPPSSTPSPIPSRRTKQDGCQCPSPTHHHHQPTWRAPG
jgi:hypothetical protein